MAKLRKDSSIRLEKLTEAFPFQREAIETVSDLPFSAIFFEQGLGKTKIAIDLTLDWIKSEVVDTVIIATKKGLVRNWLQEFEIHSHIRPRVLSSNRTANHRALFSPARVYVTNFEALALEEKKIRALSNHRTMAVILDESQKIKNPDSKLAQSFFRLSDCFAKRVIMTGTPMANRPYDIWAQIYFLDSGKSLGTSFKNFKSKLDLPKHGEKREFIQELNSVFPRISDFAIRETKEGSGLELPGKVFKTILADWEPRQRSLYEKIQKELEVEILKAGKLVIDKSEVLLKRLLRLLQVASNPRIIDDSYQQNPGKLRKTEGLVNRIVSDGEKVIVWTSFVKNCQYLRSHFSSYGAVQVHGRMAMVDRDNSVRRFKEDNNVSVLVATPASAKEGLTLTVANHVIFYDRSFSLDDYLQAQDRIHRISQVKTCYVHNIVLPNSIDEWVDVLIGTKLAAVRIGMKDAHYDELAEPFEVDLEAILKEILSE